MNRRPSRKNKSFGDKRVAIDSNRLGSHSSGERRHLRIYPSWACSLWSGSKLVIVCNGHKEFDYKTLNEVEVKLRHIDAFTSHLGPSQQTPHIAGPTIVCCNYQASIPHHSQGPHCCVHLWDLNYTFKCVFVQKTNVTIPTISVDILLKSW